MDIITEMNATNLGNNPESEDGHHDNQQGQDNTAMHGYNLRPRPIKLRERFNLLQMVQQSTHDRYFKPHFHVMSMQMSTRGGIK
jgi:hypothetical protein